MHDLLGDKLSSKEDYMEALRLSEPEGFLGVFIEQGSSVAEALKSLLEQNQLGGVKPGYVREVLAGFSSSQPEEVKRGKKSTAGLQVESRSIHPAEALTDRELDVLRLMVEGLKYKEIADQLFITLNTVRYHTKAIYGKLGVNNRTQAIEKARQRKIL